jgi:hypothetical protein
LRAKTTLRGYWKLRIRNNFLTLLILPLSAGGQAGENSCKRNSN